MAAGRNGEGEALGETGILLWLYIRVTAMAMAYFVHDEGALDHRGSCRPTFIAYALYFYIYV